MDSAVTSPAETGIAYSLLKSRTYLGLTNMPTNHPHYSLVPTYINEAKDELQTMVINNGRVRKKAFSLMPRLNNWRWYDTTVNNQYYLALPANLLWLDHVSCTRLTTAFAPASQVEYPLVEESDVVMFGQKSKTATGWPTVWCRSGSRIQLWPTPTTAFLTQIILYGARAEDDLSQSGDTLKMPLRLQKYVVDLAVAVTMEHANMIGAADKRAEVEDHILKSLDITAEERQRNKVITRIAGTPR